MPSTDSSFDFGVSPSSGYDSMEERRREKEKKSRWGRRSKTKSKGASKEDLNESRLTTCTEFSEIRASAKKDLTVTFAPIPGPQKDQHIYRVIMPDSSSTVITAEHGQTVAQSMMSLFDRRGLDFSSLQIVMQNNGEVVPFEAPASCLQNKEVRLQKAGLTFKVTFDGNDEMTTVRVDKTRTIRDVVGAVLTERGLNLDLHVVHLENCPVPLQLDIASSLLARQSVVIKPQSCLDEVTSPKEKTQPELRPSGGGSSGGFFLKLGSLRLPGFRRSTDAENTMKKVASLDDSGSGSNKSGASPAQTKKSLKKKKEKGKTENAETPTEDFMDLLSRVQSDRIDDQRLGLGDDENFQLPDFLRDDAAPKNSPSPENESNPSRESGYHSVSPPARAAATHEPRAPYIRPPAVPLVPSSTSVPDLSPTEDREELPPPPPPPRHSYVRHVTHIPDQRLRRRHGASAPELDDAVFWEKKAPTRRQRKHEERNGGVVLGENETLV